jgi:hypothetical protein
MAIYKISLIVHSFECDPDDISRSMGIRPTRFWRRGDHVLPGATNVHHENGWQLKTPAVLDALSLDEAITRFLDGMPGLTQKLAAITERHERLVECVVESRDRDAVLCLSSAAVTRIAALGAAVDIDYYDFTDA